MTQEELDTVILEETQNDPHHNSDTIRKDISLIIRLCPDHVNEYRSEPTMPLYSDFAYDPSERGSTSTESRQPREWDSDFAFAYDPCGKQ